MRRWLLILALVIAASPVLASPVLAAGKRVALVVGAGAYAAVPALPNPPRDAKAVGAVLQKLGFETVTITDPDRPAMESAIRSFGDRAQGAEAAVFFYAGHALEAGGRNMLVPVSAKIGSARDLPFETVDLDLLLSQLDGRARTLLVFLDSCRDDPFLRTLSGAGRGIVARGAGLAAPAGDVTGTLIAFATAPGHTAADGDGEHSPFTTALLHQIEAPGVEVRQMLAAVRKEVREATNGQQIPWDSSALEDPFYFRPLGVGRTAAGSGAVAAPEAAAAPTPSRCHVQHLQGKMREPGGANGTMEVTSDGRGCGFNVWRRIASRDTFDTLQVTTPPRNGAVVIRDNHQIVYTPRAGYAGVDSFVVTSVPHGTVTMRVTAAAPKS